MPYDAVEGRPEHRRFPGRAGRQQLVGRGVQQVARSHHHQRHNAGQWGHLEAGGDATSRRPTRPTVPERLRAGTAAGVSEQSPEPCRRFWDTTKTLELHASRRGASSSRSTRTPVTSPGACRSARSRSSRRRASERHTELRRRHHDRRQPGVHRRDDRRLLPRVRRTQRRGAVARQAAQCPRRARRRPTGPRRQAVRRHRRVPLRESPLTARHLPQFERATAVCPAAGPRYGSCSLID